MQTLDDSLLSLGCQTMQDDEASHSHCLIWWFLLDQHNLSYLSAAHKNLSTKRDRLHPKHGNSICLCQQLLSYSKPLTCIFKFISLTKELNGHHFFPVTEYYNRLCHSTLFWHSPHFNLVAAFLWSFPSSDHSFTIHVPFHLWLTLITSKPLQHLALRRGATHGSTDTNQPAHHRETYFGGFIVSFHPSCLPAAAKQSPWRKGLVAMEQ